MILLHQHAIHLGYQHEVSPKKTRKTDSPAHPSPLVQDPRSQNWVRGGEAPPQVELTNRLLDRNAIIHLPRSADRPPLQCRGAEYIYAEGALLSVRMTAGTPSCFEVFLAPDRFPSLRRLANGFGQGASTRLVLGTRGLKLGPEFPPRIARSRGIMIRVCRVWVSPPRIACFAGGAFLLL